MRGLGFAANFDLEIWSAQDHNFGYAIRQARAPPVGDPRHGRLFRLQTADCANQFQFGERFKDVADFRTAGVPSPIAVKYKYQTLDDKDKVRSASSGSFG